MNRNRWQTKLKELYDIKDNENKDNIIDEEVSDNVSSSSINSNPQTKLFKVEIPYNLYRTILPEKNLYKDGKNLERMRF